LNKINIFNTNTVPTLQMNDHNAQSELFFR